MTSHLVVKYDREPLTLQPDTSIDIEDKNPLFNDVGLFSYPIPLPVEGNRYVTRNVDNPQAADRAVELEQKRMDVIVDGLPLRSGVAIVQEGEEIEKTLSMNIDESTQSFDDLIGDLKCRDVPVKDEILIGEKIGEVTVNIRYDAEIWVGLSDGVYADTGRLRNNYVTLKFEPQALGFSYPGKCMASANGVAQLKEIHTYPEGEEVKVPKVEKSYINTTDEYGANSTQWGAGGAKYCNARVCYKHMGRNADGSTSSDVADPSGSSAIYEDHWPYWVLEADRPQSGICFYVLYFLDCLFAHLGVTFDKTALEAVPDLKRLCFFTTRCAYTTGDIGGVSLGSLAAINNWLESRGCGGQLKVEMPEQRELDYYTFTGDINWNGFEYHIEDITFVKGEECPALGNRKVTGIKSITHNDDSSWFQANASAQVVGMYATSDNFPDESVKTILSSLENSFGIRFRYDMEKNKVTAYLMRDVFRQVDAHGATKPVRDFFGTLHTVHPLTEKITGVRMKYSAESDGKEQMENIRRAKRDYDTDFDYIDYPEGRVNVDKQYKDIFLNASSGDMTCYVDLTTGNAYRIKVDADATTVEELRPVLFEVGAFHGVEIGNCSKQNEEYIREFVSDFQPIAFNDVNFQQERSSVKVSGSASQGGSTATFDGGTNDVKPILAAYIDEEMQHEFTESAIRTAVSPALYNIYVSQVLKLVESYDPSGTDDGNSPLQTYDWGLAVAMMRGGGSDAEVQQYDFGYDGFNNDKWRTVSGEYVMASDTMDAMGNRFDYDGNNGNSIGNEDRFSLKIRSWKPFLWAKIDGRTLITSDLSLVGEKVMAGNNETWKIPCVSDPSVLRRGLFDVFMAAYALFFLRRKKLRLKVETTVAQLAEVPNHWDDLWRIDYLTGYIDSLNYSVNTETGLGEVTIDFFSI